MNKIPTLFQRTDDRRHVTREVTPGCEWVLNGEGVATRKWDGTCVLILDDVFVRREVKPGKAPPPGFIKIGTDEITGKTMGWEPAEQSGFAKYIDEAMHGRTFTRGTYELVGPKINGNPEQFEAHTLLAHGELVMADAPRTFDELREYLLAAEPMEGIVWHDPDGRMAKLKRRDFG